MSSIMVRVSETKRKHPCSTRSVESSGPSGCYALSRSRQDGNGDMIRTARTKDRMDRIVVILVATRVGWPDRPTLHCPLMGLG